MNSSEKKEKRILRISFFAGLLFAVVELVFSIFSHSHSALMDAVYDSTELIFIGLMLFLTPLFHQPISEKRPYGYYQIESIFLIVKGFMMLSVTLSVSVNVLESIFSGGNPVNGWLVSLFQLSLGTVCLIIFMVMKRLNRSLSSPTIDAEILGWKLDVGYSFGIAVAFFFSNFLEYTPLAFIAPYFDQIITILIVLSMLPENIRLLFNAVKDVFLFPPEAETVDEIKSICCRVLQEQRFTPVFYDITRTGRKLWVSVYFEIAEKSLPIEKLQQASAAVSAALQAEFDNCSCELILASDDTLSSFISASE